MNNTERPVKGTNMMAGAGLLALAGLIAKVLSTVYRVPFQNMVGNTGFYVYQQVYPIYGIGMVLALSGWPLFISKVAAEYREDVAMQSLAMRRLFWLLCGIACVLFTIVYGGAPFIAHLMGDDLKLEPVIRAVAWMFWFMPALAIGRGFAQGQQNMLPTATSQVIEQVVRVAVILGAAFWAVQHHWSVYQMGTWTTFSATLAGLAATIFIVHILFKVWQAPRVAKEQLTHAVSWRHLLRRLLDEGGLLAILAALLVLMQLMDSFTVKSLLDTLGGLSTTAAEATKGVYDRGQPLLQLGMVVATGLGTSLLPMLRINVVQKDEEAFAHNFRLTMRLSVLLAAVSAVGMVVIMPALDQILFGSREGSVALAWYAVIILPATIITVMTSVLQSLDKTKGINWVILGSLVVKLVLNRALIPSLGIDGASIATLLALLPLTIFTLWRLPHQLWRGWVPKGWYTKVIIVLVVTAAMAFIATEVCQLWLGNGRLASGVVVLVAVLVGGLACLLTVLKLDLLSAEEWYSLPKGEHIYQILKRGNK